jgi:hypothetical protein
MDTKAEIDVIRRELGILAARVIVLRFGQREAEQAAEDYLIAAERAIDTACAHLEQAKALPLFSMGGPIICTGGE